MDARHWVVCSALLTASLWLPHVLDRMLRLGLWRTFDNPRPTDLDEQSAWARRAKASHDNGCASLPSFVALVVVAWQGVPTRADLLDALTATYFFARLLHAVAYTVGVPVLRTITFLISWGVQLLLGYLVLRAGAA